MFHVIIQGEINVGLFVMLSIFLYAVATADILPHLFMLDTILTTVPWQSRFKNKIKTETVHMPSMCQIVILEKATLSHPHPY